MSKPKRAVAALLVAAAAVAGCGTTVDVATDAAPGSSEALGSMTAAPGAVDGSQPAVGGGAGGGHGGSWRSRRSMPSGR